MTPPSPGSAPACSVSSHASGHHPTLSPCSLSAYRWGWVGAGQMAERWIKGALESGIAPQSHLVCDRHEERRALFASWGCLVIDDPKQLMQTADVVMLGVKPRDVENVLRQIAPVRRPTTWLLSFAAGLQVTQLQAWFDGPVIRTMPNLAAAVRHSTTGAYADPNTTTETQRALADAMIRAIGSVLWVSEESMLDLITATAGSGPAYFFLWVECLTTAGIALGLSPADAAFLAKETAIGAALLMQNTHETPANLRQSVTSPGGTTERAIGVFQHDDALAQLMQKATHAAWIRAQELSAPTVPSS